MINFVTMKFTIAIIFSLIAIGWCAPSGVNPSLEEAQVEERQWLKGRFTKLPTAAEEAAMKKWNKKLCAPDTSDKRRIEIYKEVFTHTHTVEKKDPNCKDTEWWEFDVGKNKVVCDFRRRELTDADHLKKIKTYWCKAIWKREEEKREALRMHICQTRGYFC